jgi:hypothetical protein
MTGSDDPARLRFKAVLKPLEWEQRMRIDHRSDLLRIVEALAASGIAISEKTAFAAWRRYSEEEHCATWYGPGSDDEIRNQLMPHLELRRATE